MNALNTMKNEGHERTEYCQRWQWPGGDTTHGPISMSREQAQAYGLPPSVLTGELAERTVTISPWEPVLPPGVLRLNQVAAAEYGGVKVAELGDGVAEGYNIVAFTDDPVKALAAVRAHFLIVHNENPGLLPRWEDEPVRWWQVFDTCGCGDTCPHGDPNDEDVEHRCERAGLPPCDPDGEDSWIGVLAEKDAPGALPFVEFEVGASYTRDEWATVLQHLLTDAEQKLRTLSKKCLAVKTTLDQPYSDAPQTTPWKQFVEQPTREAYNLAVEIRRELKARGLTT
ncbi:hypothetical protein [Lentzea cavernae]|uniref:Uncharacterized protein n=1 Tax=Lentzea cavernae TaxID=2020703 RepID=A0ABQ3MQ88_9PSEU|nr:hypothetical protein [Lentzea cavernae]GHH57560.1 hypothetical protein GCM10017774_77270 [Lentzea cavernae]